MDNRINGRATLPPLTPAQTSAARRAASETASAPAISAQDSARFTASSPGDVLAELRDLIEVLANRVEKLEDTVNQSSAPRQAAREVVAPVPALPPGVTLPPLPSARVSAPASESVVIDPETWQDIPVEAVQVALSTAKLEGLTRSEKKTVERALDRVRTIAVSIDRGENPSPYQAELFALKQTLASPGNAGRNTLATSGAQLLAQVSAGKGKLEAAIQAEEGAANRGQDASGAQKRMLVLFDSYRALVQIERLLFSLNLSDLPPEKQRAVLADFSALRSLVGDVSDQKTTGLAANEQVEDIGARLQEFAASGQGNPVQQSAKDAVMRSRTALQGALKALDERQFNGTPPEALAADRAKLLAAAEALMTLGEAVVNAKPENGTQAMRGETRKALERAEALAEALGGGQHPAEIRNALFVTAQSLKDPISSRNSPAVQAAAAALQLMGQGEAANAEARGEIQAAIEAGVEPRLHDARAVQLARQAEDFELMRRALETVNFSGLTAQKVPEATSIIGKMQTIGEKVGAGEDFALHRAEYDNLGKQLRALAAAQAPSPGSPDNPPSLPGEPPAVAPPTPPGQAQPLPNSYTVKSGDYLSKIAREQLGDSSRWAELVQLNQERYPSLKTNPNLIHPSWTLQLPANKPSVERPAQPPTAVNPPATAPAQPPTAVNPPATAPAQPPTAVNPPATAPAQPPTAVNPPATAPAQPPTAVNPPATAPAQPPTAVNPPTVRPGTPAEERARADLENFLARGENRQPDILSSALDRSPEVFRLSTPEQKARVMADLMQGFTSKEFRSSALRLLEMAEERGEVQDTLRAAAQLGQLDRILTDLGDHSAGVSMARILISANAYQASEVWKEMDDDATRALMRALGFQRPMISSSQTLRDLPEEARYHMIKQLTGGHMSVEEQAMARWINLHNEKKIEIREFQTGSELNGS